MTLVKTWSSSAACGGWRRHYRAVYLKTATAFAWGKSLMMLGNPVFIQTSLLTADLKLWPLTTRHQFRSYTVEVILALLSSCWWWCSRCGHTYLTPILPVETQPRSSLIFLTCSVSLVLHLNASVCSCITDPAAETAVIKGLNSTADAIFQFSFTKLQWS